MEITKDIKAKVFALYLGQKITLKKHGLGDWLELTVERLHHGFEFDKFSRQEVQLILKPLSDISDKDMIWVYDTCYNLHETRKLNLEHVLKHTPSLSDMKAQINNGCAHYKGGYLSDATVHQYLILNGYDVPLLLLGYKTLFEAGLAIYEYL